MTTFGSRSLVFLALAPMLLAGCSSRMIPSSTAQSAHITGNLHGGQQPVAGATIQLFDVSTVAATATPLLSAQVISDSGGNFSITGLYTCPAATDQVYLVAQGGDPGAGVNLDLVLMTALGNCGDLTSATTVSVNEISTTATVYAYSGYFDPSSSAGGGYITGGDAAAYQHFLRLVDPASGSALATSDAMGGLKLNALANSVSTCVNAPTVSGVTQQCSDLIPMAAPASGTSIPQDSAVAIYLIATHPGYNPTSIFNFAPSNPPFQPTLVSAPVDWTLN